MPAPASLSAGHPPDGAGAIAAGQETTTHRVLRSAGLDRQAIRDALDREFEHSPNAAGVSLAAFDLPRPSTASAPPTQLGASAKLALERGFASVARKKDLQPAHLLLGILRAQVGTVPRALALAGVDQDDLMARLLRTLTDAGR
ncbi:MULTISPECIES: Clp protease N-terminal domain-containing protein [Streptosporangium]|uniref:D-alanyl-D-alanine carboxypeptidase n=1 Tax=Streptosporangium brasiliense TaxID=47480 RepID=A0ABT9RMD4_9ACTN|nr:Clp protease N-terminal domain-containing protein [Streptosporangium brasiliense]MDP9869515.1 D-alanyl-D-alanine carboxypeptidase [Streptosporangium brasiliense]